MTNSDIDIMKQRITLVKLESEEFVRLVYPVFSAVEGGAPSSGERASRSDIA